MPTVTNAVLLEKINQLKENQERNITKTEIAIDKLDTRLTQNFSSMADVLRQGYVTKEDLVRLEADIENLMRDKVSESKLKPLFFLFYTVGTAIILGFVGLVGRMIWSFIDNGYIP